MKRIVVIPAIFVGCLIVIWIGTVAASQMPPLELLVPTMAAAAQAKQEPSGNGLASVNNQLSEITKSCSLSANYPQEIQQWCQLIESAASETGVPVNLIAAVMLQESGGEPLSYSSSGAVGLMQIMPRDGLAAEFMCINGPCFADRPTIKELQEPAFNINYGSQMLANLYSKHGTYREALFHYGPMNIGYHYADLVLTIWETYG